MVKFAQKSVATTPMFYVTNVPLTSLYICTNVPIKFGIKHLKHPVYRRIRITRICYSRRVVSLVCPLRSPVYRETAIFTRESRGVGRCNEPRRGERLHDGEEEKEEKRMASEESDESKGAGRARERKGGSRREEADRGLRRREKETG